MSSAVTHAALRAAVQTAIERHLQQRAQAPQPPSHVSHVLLTIVSGSEPDGACIIEPSVRCTHCGYCRSYGH
jgi:hypothetical protein